MHLDWSHKLHAPAAVMLADVADARRSDCAQHVPSVRVSVWEACQPAQEAVEAPACADPQVGLHLEAHG